VTEDLLTTREAAALLGVGTTSIKRWADSGLLACVRTMGGHRRFPRRAVEALIGQPPPMGDGSTGGVASWVSWLTGGSLQSDVIDALLVERRECGSWIAVADLMGQVLGEIGRRWARGEISVIEEHIASERLARGVAHCCETIIVPAGAPTCFLMAAEGDEHTLGLSLLELCLRESGWSTTWAGRKTPVHFACAFIESSDIKMVAVSASAHSGDPGLLADQARRLSDACRQRGIPLLLGGMGQWPEESSYAYLLRRFADLVTSDLSLDPGEVSRSGWARAPGSAPSQLALDE
jgi:excisionase family DNA binding protein